MGGNKRGGETGYSVKREKDFRGRVLASYNGCLLLQTKLYIEVNELLFFNIYYNRRIRNYL